MQKFQKLIETTNETNRQKWHGSYGFKKRNDLNPKTYQEQICGILRVLVTRRHYLWVLCVQYCLGFLFLLELCHFLFCN